MNLIIFILERNEILLIILLGNVKRLDYSSYTKKFNEGTNNKKYISMIFQMPLCNEKVI